MIVEITTNKYHKQIPSNDVLERIKILLMDNPNKWYKSEEIKILCEYADVRRAINQLRVNGLPIISGREGYKYTNNKNEIKQCYYKLRNRALIALTAANKLKKII